MKKKSLPFLLLLLQVIVATPAIAQYFEAGGLKYWIESSTQGYVWVCGYTGKPSSIYIPNEVSDDNGATYYVTHVESGSFLGCTTLENITVSDENMSLVAINGVLFNSDLTRLICYPAGRNQEIYSIPKTVEALNAYSFSDCVNLKNVDFNNSVTSIGEHAFSNCKSLISILNGENVEWIGESAFYNCSGLEKLTIGDSLTRISKQAFYGCSSISEMKTGERLQTIDEASFSGCTSLKTLTLGKTVYSIGTDAFYECPLETIYSYPEIPPFLDSYAFNNSSAIVYVPKGRVLDYRKAGWIRYYDDIREMDDTMGIEIIQEPFLNDDTMEEARYSLDGNKVDDSYKGFVIVHYSNGLTCKIYRK